MARKVVLTVLALGLFGAAANGVLVSDAFGAQWYPFYGYHRPSYLDEGRVVAVQPSAPQESTAFYPPSQDTAVPTQPTSPRQSNNSTRWYPFYGNHRPSYLDQ
jgi:hypothetical protein